MSELKNIKIKDIVIIKNEDGKLVIGQLKSLKNGEVKIINIKETFKYKDMYECTNDRLKNIGVQGTVDDLLKVKENLPLVAIPKKEN